MNNKMNILIKDNIVRTIIIENQKMFISYLSDDIFNSINVLINDEVMKSSFNSGRCLIYLSIVDEFGEI